MKFTEEYIKRVLEPYKNEFGLSLIMKCGNPNVMKEDEYDCVFCDDLGVNIRVTTKGEFSFDKQIAYVYRLTSPKMSPIDYKDHFDRSYRRFRDTVMRFR